jgi:hypothetical protein
MRRPSSAPPAPSWIIVSDGLAGRHVDPAKPILRLTSARELRSSAGAEWVRTPTEAEP